ncbi:MAG TPA: hypothetical protein VFA83_05660 [Acidimicrobiales bacterium]|nr:hypothetical protein [Acidimicrobiales bacterium]
MADEPGLLARIVAHLHGEVAVTALQAFRRGGASVWDLQMLLEQRRLEGVVNGSDAWSMPAATSAALLCGWNAEALQVLGDELLEADEATGGLGAGFVEPEMAEQTFAFYGQVAGWLSRAQQALHNPDYELDVAVPAVVPLVASTPCGDQQLTGLLAGVSRLRARTDALLSQLPKGDGEAARARHRIEQLKAEGDAAADYAGHLGGPTELRQVQTEIEGQVCCAIDRYYVVGQLAAMPRLALQPLPHLQRTRPGRPTPFPAPGDDGFDPWCLTDPRVKGRLKKMSAARDLVTRMWAADPDPVRTLAIKAEIDSALFCDDIAHDVGHFDRCPWSAIYLAKRPVRLGRTQVHPLQQFTYDVAIEYVGGKRRFVRRIVTGPFSPSRERL